MSITTSANSKVISSVIVVGIVGLSSILFKYYKYWKSNSEPKKWKRVGILQQIYFYPIKSCAPIDFNNEISVNCELLGMRKGDILERSFMLLNDDDNKMVTGRIYPKLVQITLKVMSKTTILVSAPGMENDLEIDLIKIKEETTKKYVDTRVWQSEVKVVLCGEQYDAWFSRFIFGKSTGLRLAFYPYLEPVKEVQPRLQSDGITQKKDTGTFPDATSYNLINLSSVDDLNNRLKKPVDALQFRPNFLLKMDKPEAFAEDNWKWMKIGNEVTFRVVAPCSRCIFININPYSAERDEGGNPLKMLRTYRKWEGISGPIMGIHLGLRKNGSIKANDIIYVEDN